MRPQPSDDADITHWARLAGRGDRDALERFLRATQPHVWRFVAALSDTQSADDLTQETYLRALGGLGRFRAESSARTWLLSIARRVVADHIRAVRARPRPATPADWQADAGRGAEGTAFEERVLLDHLVAALEPDRRDAFLLTQTLGLSYVDAAEVVGCPVGTIRSRVARARDDLAEAMREKTVRRNAAG
ncbi:sigma-70 family RNA polymerase sigma factor [Amycolatopsis sp. FBCC-B4732]|uniref:sigma-70 family RNA polymerase sigma factor n=1 Tax=Amycolatopsis sp. FBCC-B4732 TaxID=3079339 RepID=UPI001FF384EE|nr:sigma-70 family RNA polymerase sigma factor [Amycolatopsis sp. FBCC-B4732]UOX90779.1 sigma-70 family RNA polymerase sigma factor [Amycolatopsis sp. FBCC-B4732]